MKKALLLALVFVFLFSMVACAPAQKQDESSSISSGKNESADSAPASPDTEPSAEPAAAQRPEPEEPGKAAPTEKEIEAMLPMMDSILLSGIEGEDDNYNSANPEYAFRVLYYLCVNYCDTLPGISLDAQGGILTISEAEATRLASACFSGLTKMPPFSADFPEIKYSEEVDGYIMQLSDRSQSKSVIKNIDWQENVTNVTIELVSLDDDSSIAMATFEIVPNSYDTEGQYPFAIQNAKTIEE